MHHSSTTTAVTISWEEPEYFVKEDDGSITACARLTDGILCRDLVVQLQTIDSDLEPGATSKSTMIYPILIYALMIFP